MGTAIMSMLASLIALTHAQLEAMKQLQNSMPTLAPVHSPLSLPTLSNLQSLHSMPNFLSNQQSNNEIGQEEKERIPCTCGVFLSGQFKKGAPLKLSGGPALLQELNDPLTCNTLGEKQCINKCLETMVRHLPNSGPMICGSIDRDCYKERAYLFIKNCNDNWINSNLSAGREYCCKDGLYYKCPIN